MPSDSGDRRPARPHHVGAPAQEPEQLPCPRCDSINTKFCYYNNYNFSQPRHFCKSCRRYWTHGGTLRDIPIGGGSRKNAKRSRTTSATSASLQDHHHHHHMPATPSSILVPFPPDHGGAVPFVYEAKGNLNVCGSFTSLLNTQGPAILGLGGFGLGLSPGFEDVNFGLGRSVWPFPAAVPEGGATGGGGGSGSSLIGNSWQIESEDGFVGGDCFSLPDLAISTPGSGLK